MINIQTSYGELVDKISILLVKQEKIKDNFKLKKINLELSILNRVYENLKNEEIEKKLKTLVEINNNLWRYEDNIRHAIKENNNDEILKNSILICRTNDLRFFVKNEINLLLDSEMAEVKQHIEY